MSPRFCTPLPISALLACLAAAVAALLAALGAEPPSLHWTNKDYANYWVAAQLAADGKALDLFGPHEVYFAHMQAYFGPDYPWHNWSYPPSYLLLVLPLGLVGYKAGYILFLLVTFLLLAGAVRLAAGASRPPVPVLLLLIPALATNLLAAQNGFLLAALLIGGLALRGRRPVLSGLCLGLLTVKPQLGLLLAFLLLFERQGRVIAAAAATALALAVLSALLFGLESWRGYVMHVLPYQKDVMMTLQGLFPHMMPTLFGSMRSLGLDPDLAVAVHVPFALAVLALYVVSLSRLGDGEARAASTLFATFLAVPYLVSYDLVALVAAMLLWALRPADTALLRQGAILVAFVPLMTAPMGLLGWPVTPLVLLAYWLAFLYREGVLRAAPAGGKRKTRPLPAGLR